MDPTQYVVTERAHDQTRYMKSDYSFSHFIDQAALFSALDARTTVAALRAKYKSCAHWCAFQIRSVPA